MTKRIWKIGFIILIGFSLFLLIQMGISAVNIKQFSNEKEASSSTDTLHIIIIAQELDNPFWRLLEQGALEAAKNYTLKIDYMGPERNDVNEQVRMLQKAIASSPDGIVIQGIGNEQYKDLIDSAVGQSIPVITVDADVPESKRIAYIGTNQLEAGKQLGAQIVKNAKSNDNIGVILGSLESENQKIRLEGLSEVIALHPNINIVAIRSSNISRIKAAEESVNLLKQYPEINTFVGLSSLDGAGIVDGLQYVNSEFMQNNISVFAFDKLPLTLELIENQKIQATVAQQPELMGEKAIHTMMSYFNGQHIEVEQFVPTMIIENHNNGGN